MLAPSAQTQVLRIVQEGFANVRKHARASRVQLTLAMEQDALIVRLEDDGCGFDPEAAPAIGHFGLETMHERAAAIGATLTIHSSAGSGSRLSLDIPFPPSAARR